jgi:chromosomal replication initiator protein
MDNQSLWRKILINLEGSITRANLITWFENSTILKLQEGVLTIGVPREIFATWHLKNSRQQVYQVAKGLIPELTTVEFAVEGKLENTEDDRGIKMLEVFPKEAKTRKMPRVAEVKVAGKILSRQLSKKFQLSNFITGSESRLAHAARQAVAKSPGEKYNPLFIYGSVGLGKTHLLHGIGNTIVKNRSELIVAYVSAENFVAEFIDNIRNQKIDKFREKWRRADVFLIDDIQFLAGKERTEEFFFHLFNDLFDAGKQIVITSDKPPVELKEMSDRLVSRFAMGMIADLYFPGLETRMAIIQQKAQEYGVVLDLEIIEFIAQNVFHSVREIEGILKQIIAMIDLEGISPTKASVTGIIQKVNKNLRETTKDEEALANYVRNMSEVVDKVSDFFSITKAEIIGSNRSREFVVPRQIAMWFCKKKLKEPLKRIGSFFGGRDHTSVINSIKRVEQMRKTDPQFWRNVNSLRRSMGF